MDFKWKAQYEELNVNVDEMVDNVWKEYELGEINLKKNITRGEMALLIDKILNPFNKKKVDIHGTYIEE